MRPKVPSDQPDIRDTDTDTHRRTHTHTHTTHTHKDTHAHTHTHTHMHTHTHPDMTDGGPARPGFTKLMSLHGATCVGKHSKVKFSSPKQMTDANLPRGVSSARPPPRLSPAPVGF